MNYDAIIFDLDGTLWDASNVTAQGWNNALAKQGLDRYRITGRDVKKVSGMPFSECIEYLFEHIAEINCKELERIIDVEEEKSFEAHKGQLYPHVETGVKNLSGKYPLFLVSNCQSWYLKTFWNQFGMAEYFTGEDCNGNANKQKPAMIRALQKLHSLKNPLYIGDTKGDQQACKDAGVDFGFARYGFGEVDNCKISFTSFEHLVHQLM